MEIPNNNLPIYLQQYSVRIVDGETNEPKGNIQYSTVGAIPSNQIQRRVWNLNLTGKLDPNADIYKIVYDFSNVNLKELVTFENDLSGTFRICDRVMDASKIMTYEYSEKESTLTILINRKKWGFRLRKSTLFSYTLEIDDEEVCCDCHPVDGLSLSEQPVTIDVGQTVNLEFVKNYAIQLENNEGKLNFTKKFYWYFGPKDAFGGYAWFYFNNPVSSGTIPTTSGCSTLKLSNGGEGCSGENINTINLNYVYNTDGSVTVFTVNSAENCSTD